MEIYEYLLAAIIVVLILMASSTMVIGLTDPIRSASQKEQLEVVGEKVMTQFLLDPGSPVNWGKENTSISEFSSFGLAKYEGTSREAYNLDPDKVQRLNFEYEPSYVPALFATELLNIKHDYGFTLEFNQTLKVEVVYPLELGTENCEISVTSDYSQLPIINAKVTGALYYVDSG